MLHGDLWSGNIGTANGQPAVFDPAVYHGHSEAEFGEYVLPMRMTASSLDFECQVKSLRVMRARHHADQDQVIHFN